MTAPLWNTDKQDFFFFFFLAANPHLLFSHGTSINIYVTQVTVSCTILLDRMATCGLVNCTFTEGGGGADLLQLLYQSVLFKNSESAWPLEIFFIISIKDLDEETIHEVAQWSRKRISSIQFLLYFSCLVHTM